MLYLRQRTAQIKNAQKPNKNSPGLLGVGEVTLQATAKATQIPGKRMNGLDGVETTVLHV